MRSLSALILVMFMLASSVPAHAVQIVFVGGTDFPVINVPTDEFRTWDSEQRMQWLLDREELLNTVRRNIHELNLDALSIEQVKHDRCCSRGMGWVGNSVQAFIAIGGVVASAFGTSTPSQVGYIFAGAASMVLALHTGSNIYKDRANLGAQRIETAVVDLEKDFLEKKLADEQRRHEEEDRARVEVERNHWRDIAVRYVPAAVQAFFPRAPVRPSLERYRSVHAGDDIDAMERGELPAGGVQEAVVADVVQGRQPPPAPNPDAVQAPRVRAKVKVKVKRAPRLPGREEVDDTKEKGDEEK